MKAVIICVILIISPPLYATELNIITHSLQGQVEFIDGEMRGISNGGKRSFNVELVREMMARIGTIRGMEEVPFKRGLKKAQREKGVAFFNVSRTAERENTVQWVGPLQVETDYFYEMAEKPTGVRVLEDAKKVSSICVLTGGIHYEILKKAGFTNIFANTSYVNCFKMLKSGRVALTASAASTVEKKLKSASIAKEEIHQTPVILAKTGGYLVFSKDVDTGLVGAWQRVLNQIKEDTTYLRLYENYLIGK